MHNNQKQNSVTPPRQQLGFNFTLLFLLCSFTVAAQAQFQVFIGAQTGQDAGACTANAPCRNVNYALTQVAAGGEINIIESGDYAPATITKAVTVQSAPGILATFTTAFGTGIAVNAASSDVIGLRGLFLNGQGTANQGVSVGGGSVQIDRLTVTRFNSQGIILNSASNKNVITNTVISNCNIGIGIGLITTGIISNYTVIENCSVQSCQVGYSLSTLNVGNLVRATIRNSSAVHCTLTAFNHSAGAGSVASTLEGILATNNNTALRTSTGVTVRVSNSVIAFNDTGLNTSSGGSLLTRLNNTFENNNIPGAFTGTYSAK